MKRLLLLVLLAVACDPGEDPPRAHLAPAPAFEEGDAGAHVSPVIDGGVVRSTTYDDLLSAVLYCSIKGHCDADADCIGTGAYCNSGTCCGTTPDVGHR